MFCLLEIVKVAKSQYLGILNCVPKMNKIIVFVSCCFLSSLEELANSNSVPFYED